LGLLCCALSAGCDRPATRAAVLRGAVEQFAVPGTRAVVEASAVLRARLAELERGPDALKLSAAQAAWKRALLAWERMQAFRSGPIVESRALLRAMFWPPRIASIQALCREPSRLDEAQVERLGVDVRGMFALEWLLFAEPAGRLTRAEGSCERALASAFARNVEHYAKAAQSQLGDGAALADDLSRAEAEGVRRFVNLMIMGVEELASEGLAAALEARAPHPRELRGGYSGSSSELLFTQLMATEQLYLGERGAAGLGSLVKQAAPPIDAHLRALFAAAHRRVQALDAGLDVLAARDRPRLEQAQAALKELERALKDELTSALGVTLSFVSSDGD
jgi:uncharacterized protein